MPDRGDFLKLNDFFLTKLAHFFPSCFAKDKHFRDSHSNHLGFAVLASPLLPSSNIILPFLVNSILSIIEKWEGKTISPEFHFPSQQKLKRGITLFLLCLLVKQRMNVIF